MHATEVGGTHPALVEAMGFGNCVLVNDVPENREVAGEAALYFAAADPDSSHRRCGGSRGTRPGSEPPGGRGPRAGAFSWDAVTDQYEALCDPAGREMQAA